MTVYNWNFYTPPDPRGYNHNDVMILPDGSRWILSQGEGWTRTFLNIDPTTGSVVGLVGPDGGALPVFATKTPILQGASSGANSGWLPIGSNPERFLYQLDSGSVATTFSVDISADGVSSLGQAFTGTWASSTLAEITFPVMFSNPQAKFFRWNVVSGGPLSVYRGA